MTKEGSKIVDVRYIAICTICKYSKVEKPTSEHKFLSFRKFKFDYAWIENKVALEVEGGIWRKGGGAHSRPKAILRDIEKYNLATINGWRVIRCTPQSVSEGVDLIIKLIKLNSCNKG